MCAHCFSTVISPSLQHIIKNYAVHITISYNSLLFFIECLSVQYSLMRRLLAGQHDTAAWHSAWSKSPCCLTDTRVNLYYGYCNIIFELYSLYKMTGLMFIISTTRCCFRLDLDAYSVGLHQKIFIIDVSWLPGSY